MTPDRLAVLVRMAQRQTVLDALKLLEELKGYAGGDKKREISDMMSRLTNMAQTLEPKG